MKKFEECLKSKKVNFSSIVGFRVRESDYLHILRLKLDLIIFFCKRKILMDGVSTELLEVTLTPWETDVILVEKPQNPMSNLYSCQIRMDQKHFHSSEQLFCCLVAT